MENEAINLTAESSAKKIFAKLGLYMLIGTILINGLQIFVSALVTAAAPAIMENDNFALIIQMLPVYIVGMPVLIYLLGKLPGQTPAQQVKPTPGKLFMALSCTYAIMIISNMIGLILTGIIGLIKGSAVENVILDVTTSVHPLIAVAVIGIAAPIMEELIFRKGIVNACLPFGEGVAIVISGLTFALFHGNLNQFAYAFGLGAFFAFVYIKTGNIKVSMGLHMIVNLMSGVVASNILNLMDYEALMAAEASGNPELIMEYVMSHIVGFLVYLGYSGCVFVLVVLGIIFLLVNRKKYPLQKGQLEIPKGQRAKTILANPGMIIYCLFWIAMIISQLFM